MCSITENREERSVVICDVGSIEIHNDGDTVIISVADDVEECYAVTGLDEFREALRRIGVI